MERLLASITSKGAKALVRVAQPLEPQAAPLLVAAQDVGAGEALLAVGEQAWLSPAAVAASPIGPFVASLDPWLQVALLLVHERFVAGPGGSSSSGWGPYVASLPTTPASPLFWPAQQLELLQGTQLMDTMQGYRSFFASTYEELLGEGGALRSQPAAAAAFPPGAFTFDNFLWGVATVRARAHAPLDADAFALVPVADAVSHRRQPNAAWKLKQAGLFGRDRQLVVEATRAVRKGEEVSIDYAPGKLDNAVLLDHGVFDGSAPKPGYALSLSLAPDDRNIDDKVDIVQEAGLGTTQSFMLVPGEPPSQGMLAFLRLMQLKGPDAFLLESIFRADVWGFMEEPVSEDNERAVCEAMAQGAQEALQGYPCGIDESLALLAAGTHAAGTPEQAAIMVRLGEQEALDGTLQWFQDRMSGKELKKLVYYQERRLRRLGLVDDEGRTTYDSFFQDGIA